MCPNSIKLIVRKQLKMKYQNGKWLNGEKKKEIARLVLNDEAFDFDQKMEVSFEELIGIVDQFPTSGI